MTVAISRASRRGARVAICASTGNTSASLAAYAARAGMAAVVWSRSTGISASKVAQTLDYGAHVVAVDGDFDAALRSVRALDPRARRDRQLGQPVSHRRAEVRRRSCCSNSAAGAPDWVVFRAAISATRARWAKGFAKRSRSADRCGPALGGRAGLGRGAVRARLPRERRRLRPGRRANDRDAIQIGAPASWKKARAEVPPRAAPCSTSPTRRSPRPARSSAATASAASRPRPRRWPDCGGSWPTERRCRRRRRAGPHRSCAQGHGLRRATTSAAPFANAIMRGVELGRSSAAS